MPPRGCPGASGGWVKYPLTLELQSYPHIQNLGALSAKARKLEQKVPKCPQGAPPEEPWGVGGVKYPHPLEL